jgi:iduronate 2-sulfatase
MPVYGQRGLPGGEDNTCLEVERTDFTFMGYTMRTDRYRYTEWVKWNGSALRPIWGVQEAAELYDHQGDDGAWTNPDKYENVNLVKSASPDLVVQLSTQLHAAFGFPDA